MLTFFFSSPRPPFPKTSKKTRPPLEDVHHQAGRRPLRLHQPRRVRVRPLRRGPLIDVGLRGARHGGRPRLQGPQEQLHRRDRRRRHHGRDGLRGDEPRGLPRHQHDCDPQRQPAGVPADAVQREEPGPGRGAELRAGPPAGQQAAAGAARAGQVGVEAAARAAAGGDGQDRRVCPRHDFGVRVDAV